MYVSRPNSFTPESDHWNIPLPAKIAASLVRLFGFVQLVTIKFPGWPGPLSQCTTT